MNKSLQIALFAGLLYILIHPAMSEGTTVSTADISHVGYYAFEKIPVWGGGREGAYLHAGVYMLNKTNGFGEGNLWNDGVITGFCMELAEPHTYETVQYNIIKSQNGPVTSTNLSSAMGSDKAKYLHELWGRYYDPAWATSPIPTAQQDHEAANFAVAIWEIVHEDLPKSSLGWDVTIDGTAGEGGFNVGTGDYSLANKWLHSLDGTGPMADLRVLSSSGYQDYLVAVPEPATIFLLCLGSFAFIKKRRA